MPDTTDAIEEINAKVETLKLILAGVTVLLAATRQLPADALISTLNETEKQYRATNEHAASMEILREFREALEPFAPRDPSAAP